MSGKRTKALRRACIEHLGHAPKRAVIINIGTPRAEVIELDEFRRFRRGRIVPMTEVQRLVRVAAEKLRVRRANTCDRCGGTLTHIAGPGSYRALLCGRCDVDIFPDAFDMDGDAA